MKKKITILLFLLLPILCFAQSSTDYDNWIYEGDKNITEYKIPDGVKKIGKHAFSGCKKLKKIIFPYSVIEIGEYACDSCYNLQTITINNGVQIIGKGAFYLCTNLQSVTIPESVEEIHGGAFSSCYRLRKFEVDKYNKHFSTLDGVLFNYEKTKLMCCPNKEQYDIPRSTEVIEKYAFQGCKLLKSVTIPNSVKVIDNYALSLCDSLTSIIIPESISSMGKYVFWGCKNLKEVTIANGLTKIEEGTFMECENLTSITIPESVTVIGESAFELCKSLKTVFIPKNVKEIELCAFSSCYNLQKFEVDSRNNYFSSINGVLFNYDKTKLVICPNKKEYTIPSGTKIIGKYAFQGNRDMVSVTIPNSVEIIEDGAFSVCNGLTSITIPKSVKEIGSAVFWQSENLKTVNLPEGITEIKRRTFQQCKNLKTITIPKSVESIGELAFLACSNLSSITIPANVKTIGDYAFQKCGNLKNVTIKNGVEHIGQYAFSMCNSLTEITIPGSVKEIDTCTFWKSENLKTVKLSNGIETIRSHAFNSCTNLENLSIPRSMQKIEKLAFKGCDKLKTVTSIFGDCNHLKSVIIENGVEKIESYAFDDFENLRDISIPYSIKAIKMPFLRWCPSVERIDVDSDNQYFTSIDGVLYSKDTTVLICFPPAKSAKHYVMPKSVKVIGTYAFAQCQKLGIFKIPDHVTDIQSNAFEQSRLRKLTIPGSFKAIKMPFLDYDYDFFVKRIDVDSDNQYFTSIDGVLYSKDTTVLICFPQAKSAKHYVMPKSVKVIGTNAFARCQKLGNFKIPDHVTDIQSNAFEQSRLRKLTIPGSYKTIGKAAFSSLRGRKGYYNCHVKLQPGIEIIGEFAFYDSGIRSIKIPNSVKYIGANAFCEARSLKSITIPGSVKSIEEGAFKNIGKLSNVTIENGVEKIGNEAFLSPIYDANTLRHFNFAHPPNKLSIVIPSSVKEIGDNVFADLSSISCPDDTSARMKFLLYKCMMEVHIANYRNDSAQYYVNKVVDILKSLHNDGNDYSSLYSILVDFYSKLYDFPKVKLYCKEGIEQTQPKLADDNLSWNEYKEARTKLNPFLLKLADANISLYEYKEADSVLNVFETINGIRHINEWMKKVERDRDRHLPSNPPNMFDWHEGSDYWYEKVKLYYESNDSQKLKFLTQKPASYEYGMRNYTKLTSYWLRANVILFKNFTWNRFKDIIHDLISHHGIMEWDHDFLFGSTIGDCYYHYNQVDSAFTYYSEVFDFELEDLKNYYSYMNIYQRQYYWQEHKATFDNVVKISTKLPDNKDALIMAYNSLLVSKGIILASEESLSNNIQNTKDEKLIDDFYKLKKYRTMLDSDCDPNMRDNILELAGRLETDLMLRSTQYADVVNYMKVDWQMVKNSLGDNDMAVEFFFDNDSLYALVLKNDFDTPKLIPLNGFNKDFSFYSTTELYEAVWKPLEQYMSENGNTYFSPSGALYNIAIEYAPIDSTHTISDKYKIYRISSTRNLALSKNKPNPNKKAATYGGIQYNFGPGNWADRKDKEYDSYVSDLVAFRDVPDLENTTLRTGVQNLIGTKIEAQQITEILRNNGYQVSENNDIYATEESFKKLSGSGLNLLHIATHGFYQPKDTVVNNSYEKEDISLSQSGLLFAGANSAIDPQKRKEIPEGFDDGILTAKEISRMDLKGLDLVVLSACQTGLGEVTSEGVFGLQRGFKKAGANTIVMSLWKVDDNATKDLMTEFYKNLVSGKSKRDAFLAAQAMLRSKYKDPRMWAAFVMVDGVE